MEIVIIVFLVLLCVVLMAVEVFILPGTTLAGIASACSFVLANYLAFSWFGIQAGLWALTISLIVCSLLAYRMLNSKTLNKYSLHRSINSTVATSEQLSVKVGDSGIATTRLALIGNADIDGKVVEVKSADGFLDEGTPLVVIRTEEAQILVKRKN